MFEVKPDDLRAASGALALLQNRIDEAPRLDADPAATKLRGLSVGAALAKSNAASSQAKEVVKARFNEFSTLLTVSADNFHGSDLDAAQRLSAVSDLNSGNAHSGS